MDVKIEELLSLTQEIVGRIEDTTYEELAEFIDWRETIISAILESEAQGQIALKTYQPIIEKILSYDRQLLDRMNHLKLEASDELIKFQATKKQRSSYDTAYNGDSFFYDKRK